MRSLPVCPMCHCCFDHIIYCHVASCCNEAFKVATTCAPYLDNYMMYVGTDGIFSYTFKHEQREDCPVCGGKSIVFEINKDMIVEELIELLTERQDM